MKPQASKPVGGEEADIAVHTESAFLRMLLIDDDHDDFLITRDLLQEIHGDRFRLDWIADPATGVKVICEHRHDVILLDFFLGAKTGIELLEEVKARNCSGPVILLTGQDRTSLDTAALQAGADDYLEKASLTPALLDRAIRFAIAKFRSAAELERKVKERTEELAKANAALQESHRLKDVFLATLAHELRNPLAPIRNSLEIIRLAGDTGSAVKRQRERMERQVTQMVRLVDDLLDISRLATNKLRLTVEPLQLQEVLEHAIEMNRSAIEQAGLALQTHLEREQIPIAGDRVRLIQVFGNLLNNAVKFTESGGTITITLQRRAGRANVLVSDTGVGIPAEALPTVFEMFTQVERTLHHSQTGLGIGLALASRLLDMHGGGIAAASEGPGRGATFTVQLPIAAVA